MILKCQHRWNKRKFSQDDYFEIDINLGFICMYLQLQKPSSKHQLFYLIMSQLLILCSFYEKKDYSAINLHHFSKCLLYQSVSPKTLQLSQTSFNFFVPHNQLTGNLNKEMQHFRGVKKSIQIHYRRSLTYDDST